MDFKHLKLEEGVKFEDDQAQFLKTLDDAFDAVLEKNTKDKKETEQKYAALQEQLKKMAESQNFEKMQAQLNVMFEKLDVVNNGRPATPEAKSKQERILNNKWVRAFVKKDVDQMKKIAMELKEPSGSVGTTFDPFMHTGTQTDHENYLEQGSYLIPELFQQEVNRFVYESGVARREMRYLPFGGPGNERRIPRATQTVVVSWVDEAGKKPKTKPYIGQVIQTLKKLAAIVPFTDELLEDSAIDLMSYTAQLIGEEIGREEDRVFLSGSIIAGDPFDGVLNATGVVTVPMAAATQPGDLDADLLNQAIYAIPTPARPGAKWYMNPEVFGALQRIRTDQVAAGDNAGHYLIQQPTGDQPARMWNYPIVLTDELPGLTDAGGDPWDASTPFMFFANLQKTCVYGDKGGLALKMLDQASLTDDTGNVYNLAEHDMTAIRAVKRVGYVPVLPEGIAVITTGAAT